MSSITRGSQHKTVRFLMSANLFFRNMTSTLTLNTINPTSLATKFFVLWGVKLPKQVSDHLPHLMPRTTPLRNLLLFPEPSDIQGYFYPLHYKYLTEI